MKRNEFLFCLDHRWRQNVVRTKRWHTRRSRVCHWCFYHILTSSVIYYWIRRTATWNLFVSYNNETSSFFKIFQHNAKAGLLPRARLCPAFAGKKPFAVWSIQNEAISLVAMCSKELWLVEKNRATVKPDSSIAPRLMKTYSESLRIELRNLQILKKTLEKSSQFLSSEQPCEAKSLDDALKIIGVKKKTLGKLVVIVNLEAIWFEVWMKGA